MNKINVIFKNTGKTYPCDPGTSLSDLLRAIKLEPKTPILAAYSDNRLKSLSYRLYNPHIIELLDMTD
ncbi:MAG: nucleoside kinase, partial [Bacteroidales bacterium]